MEPPGTLSANLRLNNKLKKDWAVGKLSSRQVQEYAMGAMQQGASGLDAMSAIGNSGANLQKSQRGLVNLFGSQAGAPPLRLSIESNCLQRVDERQLIRFCGPTSSLPSIINTTKINGGRQSLGQVGVCFNFGAQSAILLLFRSTQICLNRCGPSQSLSVCMEMLSHFLITTRYPQYRGTD